MQTTRSAATTVTSVSARASITANSPMSRRRRDIGLVVHVTTNGSRLKRSAAEGMPLGGQSGSQFDARFLRRARQIPLTLRQANIVYAPVIPIRYDSGSGSIMNRPATGTRR